MATYSPDLPSSLRSLWRSLRLGFRTEPRLMTVSFITCVAAAVPDALLALGLRWLTQAVIERRAALIMAAALGLAALATGNWLLSMASDRVNLRLSERAAVHIEAHVAGLQASVVGIEHHERPEILDRLSLLRDHVAALSPLYRSLFLTVGALVRLAITLILLISVRPVLGLLVIFAAPTALVSHRRAAVEKAAEEKGAQPRRRARHLFVLGSTPGPGKEIRVAGVQRRIRDGWQESWDASYRPMARARWISAGAQAATWALFGAAFAAAVGSVALGHGASAANVALVLGAASRLSQYVLYTVSETHFLRTIWLEASRTMVWLEDYAAAAASQADLPAPSELRQGITLEDVSFRYPGGDRPALAHVNLTLPAGQVVALVGENGAGKTTLVKLLCRFYDPTAGRITVDDTDLSRISAPAWRERLAGVFQDFFRFEYRAQWAVGLGDLDRLDDRPAADTAAERAGAADVIDGLPDGWQTQLGVGWHDGIELSFGQWQKLALARGFMRDEPLLVVLDEPTAALDAETEHSLFVRYAAEARSGRNRAAGTIMVLVSHRFSTVRMADLIVVLDGAQVIEQGSHAELIARGGRYAELCEIQAAAYRT
jgi:ATP-binding cassette subfamily B protein